MPPSKKPPKPNAKRSNWRMKSKSLQAERKQVRSRIEKLLGQIDQLSAS